MMRSRVTLGLHRCGRVVTLDRGSRPHMAPRTAANRGRHSMAAVCNSPSRMAAWYSRTGDPALGLASGPAGHGRVADPDPPDRGAASIGAKDRSGAAASADGAGTAPLGAWQAAQQLSGVRPGGQVPRRPHCISPQLPWPRSHAAKHEIINPRMWILMGQEEASISCRGVEQCACVCPAPRARPGLVVASAARSAPLLRLLTK